MICQFCQCTNQAACAGGCIWVAPEFCSRCAVSLLLDAGELEAAEQLDRLVHNTPTIDAAAAAAPRILVPGRDF